MHLAWYLRCVRQVGRLLDRQRIHIGAKSDPLDIPLAGRLAAPDDTNDAGAAQTRRDLVTAEFPKPLRHECRSAVNVVQQFRVFMDVPAPGLNIGLQIGDAIDDGHGKTRSRLGACFI